MRRTAHWCDSSTADTCSIVHPTFVTKNDAARDRRQLVVVDEDDASRTDEAPEVDEVDEHAAEAVVAVDEREVETATFGRTCRTVVTETSSSSAFW